MMTKQHFKLFAVALAQIEDDVSRETQMILIGSVLKESNPKFDWARFQEYIRRIRAGEDLKGLK